MPWETPRPRLTTTLRPRLLDALGDESAALAWALRLGLVRSLAARPVLARLFGVDPSRIAEPRVVLATLDRLARLVPRTLAAPPLAETTLAAVLEAFPPETAPALAAPNGLGWLFHELLAHEKAEVFRDASAKIGGARLLPATRLYTPRAIASAGRPRRREGRAAPARRALGARSGVRSGAHARRGARLAGRRPPRPP
jgi:hypothetical protein